MDYTVNKIDTNTGKVIASKHFTNSIDAMFYVQAMTSLDSDKAVSYEFG